MIVEAVISVALLATAAFALTKLARSAAELSGQSDQRLTATLTAENALERLRGYPLEQLSDQASEVAKVASETSGCDVQLKAEPFTTGTRKGIHLRVDVVPSPHSRVTLHDWRFESPQVENEDSEPEANEGDDA